MNDPQLDLLLQGRHHDPHGLLGVHETAPGQWRTRHLDPHAQTVSARFADGWRALPRRAPGLFELACATPPELPLTLRVERSGGHAADAVSPWAFAPDLPAQDLASFNEGRHAGAGGLFGAHFLERDGVTGVRFACWAPNAGRVSVVGDFNRWDGRAHPMTSRGSSGVWELFIPGLGAGTLYKFELRNRDSGAVFLKTDPYGAAFELRPGTAACVLGPSGHRWRDEAWMRARARRDWLHAPLNAYEVHAGSWRRHPDGSFHSYRELAEHLVPYVRDMGYTHIEFMPLAEHPLDESWGYQCSGYFAPTSRFGTADDLRALIDACHGAGLGVILDWVPGHFPRDDWALARFDGSALYEHEDPRLGLHQDWGTLVFNYGRGEVRSFLLSSAAHWLSEFHIDGLRVDAVASMLYLDYSRREGEWLPNRHGGRENLEAMAFLRDLNTMVHRDFPGGLTFAEESTAWPMVSRPVHLGGLGFSMKWNMGWMNDSLAYMSLDPIHRRFHHERLTFGQMYAYSENFLLPLSHDEVVHGKRSLLGRMPGDAWQKFASLRLLLAWQTTSPGKKLLFMGGEFGQGREWRVGGELDWGLLDIGWHAGVRACVRDLNRLYRDLPALHELDFETGGFQWIDCHDAEQSVVSWMRRGRDGAVVVVAANFTPVPRHAYRIGAPVAGRYRERLNTDSAWYGGSDLGNGVGVSTEPVAWMGFPDSMCLTLPPLALVLLEPDA